MDYSKKNRLIILRGPSGAGKTTIAKKLFQNAKNKTVLIQQDYYRFIFNPAGGGSKPNSDVIHTMIEHNVSVALDSGYDVILEGILSVTSYQEIIERLITSHAGPSFIFYFDVSFEETLKRHETREGKFRFGEAEMRDWYHVAHASGHELETVLSEDATEDQIIEDILNISGFEVTHG